MEIMAPLMMVGTWVAYVLALACILYAIIRFAVVHALRQARHEARIEQGLPDAATWLNRDERSLLDMANSSRDT